MPYADYNAKMAIYMRERRSAAKMAANKAKAEKEQLETLQGIGELEQDHLWVDSTPANGFQGNEWQCMAAIPRLQKKNGVNPPVNREVIPEKTEEELISETLTSEEYARLAELEKEAEEKKLKVESAGGPSQ